MTVRRAVAAVRAYLLTLVMVSASSLVGLAVAPRWGSSSVDLLYLPAVLAAAGFYGLGAGVVAAIASALAFNYLFTHPYHTFWITNPQDVATVGLLFLVAAVTSQLAAAMRTQARAAAANALRNATIASFARRLLTGGTEEQVGAISCREIGALFDCDAVLLAGQPRLRLVAASVEQPALSSNDLALASAPLEPGWPFASGAGGPGSQWRFYPVRAGSAALAVLGLSHNPERPMPPRDCALLESLVDQVALALERARLDAEARDFAAVRERDRLRSALLSTIGQDMHPRLSAIAGATRGLMRAGTSDKGLTSQISAETGKLQRYLADLVKLRPECDDLPVTAGAVTIDLFHRTVRRDGKDIHLAPKEYAVLAEMAKHRGRVLSHAHLLRAAWGPAQESQPEYLRVAIRALRQKLEEDPARPSLILNEPAVGYRLRQ